jgi:hypothetical protein
MIGLVDLPERVERGIRAAHASAARRFDHECSVTPDRRRATTPRTGRRVVGTHDLEQRRAMTYAFTQDVPVDAAFYARVTEGLGPEPPEGLIDHLAIERPEGGLHYIDVWESEAACERFTEERLHPVVHGLLSEIFGDLLPPEPERVPLPLVHIWGKAVPAIN